jgi:excisionase family DNA binding protein
MTTENAWRVGNSEDLLTEEETGAILKVSPRTIRLWRRTRGLPHTKITTKVVRIRRADLEGWMLRFRVAQIGQP